MSARPAGVRRLLVAGGGTGGHVFAGVAIADAWRARHGAAAEVLYVGAAGAIEERLVPRAGLPLRTLRLGGLSRVGIVRQLRTLGLLPVALFRAWRLARNFRPEAAIGVGGYVSGPALLGARLAGVGRLAILEQNAAVGLTNRWLARFCDLVFCAFKVPVADLPAGRAARVVGNPIRATIRPAPLPADSEAPFAVFVFGGSLGATGINSLVLGALERIADLRGQVRFIHQTGQADLERVRLGHANAGFADSEVSAFIDDMPAAYARASLVVCRSGASTLAELAAVGRPAVFVPYPFHADRQQEKNARIFVDAGAGFLLDQTRARPEDLERILRDLLADRGRLRAMAERATPFYRPDSAREIAAWLAGDA